MAKHEEGCPGCKDEHERVLKLDVDDPRRPGNTKEIRGFYHCGLCVAEYKRLRADDSPEVRDQSPGDFMRLEIGSTQYGFQVWCRRHDVNVIHADFEGKKITANMTRAGAPH